jgi:hypothetical protein
MKRAKASFREQYTVAPLHFLLVPWEKFCAEENIWTEDG